jgi:hypothetical protein
MKTPIFDINLTLSEKNILADNRDLYDGLISSGGGPFSRRVVPGNEEQQHYLDVHNLKVAAITDRAIAYSKESLITALKRLNMIDPNWRLIRGEVIEERNFKDDYYRANNEIRQLKKDLDGVSMAMKKLELDKSNLQDSIRTKSAIIKSLEARLEVQSSSADSMSTSQHDPTCKRCNGDGGAGGRCPVCHGNGIA